METEVEIRKIETEPPAIAVTAIAMVLALAGIIVLQKYANRPTPEGQAVEQTTAR
jgi:hypothetical protein